MLLIGHTILNLNRRLGVLGSTKVDLTAGAQCSYMLFQRRELQTRAVADLTFTFSAACFFP